MATPLPPVVGVAAEVEAAAARRPSAALEIAPVRPAASAAEAGETARLALVAGPAAVAAAAGAAAAGASAAVASAAAGADEPCRTWAAVLRQLVG